MRTSEALGESRPSIRDDLFTAAALFAAIAVIGVTVEGLSDLGGIA